MENKKPVHRKNTPNLTKVHNDMKKYYSSKFIRNSATNILSIYQKAYASKYFSSNKNNNKRDTFNTLLNNNISGSSRKITNISKNVNNYDNNINNYCDQLYQNENHLKKHILKKKKEEHKKKPRVSFKNNTPKADNYNNFKFKKKLNFSNYINDKDNNLLSTKPNENCPEEEDGQSYGYNKKYSLKMINENDKDNEKLNLKEYTPKISLFNKLKSRDIDLEENKMHKIFNTINFKDKEIAKRTFKKSKSRTFLKSSKNISSKTPKEHKKKNNNIFNINYNINVKHKKNNKKKNTKNNKHEVKKDDLGNKEIQNQVEKIIEENSENKNNECLMTNKISHDKQGNKDDDKLKKTKMKNIYKLNCCFSFFACLRGNNE